MMFWTALAAQLSSPGPSEPQGADVVALFSSDDFPAYLRDQGVSRAVLARVTVGTDGSITRCEAEESSGDRNLDAYTCALIVKRAKFMSARWIDGTPSYGVLRVPVVWAIGPNPQDVTSEDLQLNVDRLPPGVHSPHVERLMIAVDETGKVKWCAAASSRGMSKSNPELARVGCEQVTKNYKPIPPIDAVGNAVRSIQNALVRFDRDH